MAKVRLHHFDMLKGIAIFLVVIGHVLTMCIRDIDRAVLFKFVEKIHMPIFFFISGYLTFKSGQDGKLNKPDLLSRAKQLLVPFLCVSTLWIYYFPNSGLQSPFISTFEGLYFSAGKNGYWFTLCLFEIILLYWILAPLFSYCRKTVTRTGVVVGAWSILYVLYKFVIPQQVNNLIGMPLLCEFFPIFMIGAIAKSEHEAFDRITVSNLWITVSMLIGSVLMYLVCWPWEFGLSEDVVMLAKQILYMCVVVIAIAVVKPWGESAFGVDRPNGTFMARIWKYLGSQSLGVYLLHYFFLFPMAVLREPLLGMNLNLVPTLIVGVFFASIIISVTLCVNHIISKSKFIALLLTGKNN